MKNAMILVACISGMIRCMDTAPDIDMMILKKIGIAKIEEALKSKQNETVLPTPGNEEPYFVEKNYLLDVKEIIDPDAQDPFTRAILDRIACIKKRDGGYYPHRRHLNDIETVLPNNKLGDYTNYWRETKENGTPYIRYQFACDHEYVLLKALQKLRNQKQ